MGEFRNNGRKQCEPPFVKMYWHEIASFRYSSVEDAGRALKAMAETAQLALDACGRLDNIPNENDNTLFAVALRRMKIELHEKSERGKAAAAARYEKQKSEKQEQAVKDVSLGASVYGSEQNVYLTPDQYNSLVALAAQYQMRIDDVNNIIETLSCKLKDGTKQSADHFATLKSWLTYRAEKAEERANDPRQETFDEHNRRVYQQACRNLGLTK